MSIYSGFFLNDFVNILHVVFEVIIYYYYKTLLFFGGDHIRFFLKKKKLSTKDGAKFKFFFFSTFVFLGIHTQTVRYPFAQAPT